MRESKLKLFCLPYAGGRAEVFKGIAEQMPENISVIPVEYAGHGIRAKEEFYKTFSEMVEDVAAQITEQLKTGEVYALFGYSMGSVVAYELIKRRLLPTPKHLFLAAHEAPGEQWESKAYADMDDAAFAKAILEFGGFDRFEESFLQNRHFRRMIFDPIREDYRLITDYKYRVGAPVEVSATMFYSPKDIAEEHIVKWRNYIEGSMEFVAIGDNHFFIKEYGEQLADMIVERCEKAENM